MFTIEKFINFFMEKLQKEQNKCRVRIFANRGDFKPVAKILKTKMRPTGGPETNHFINKIAMRINIHNLPSLTFRKDSAISVTK